MGMKLQSLLHHPIMAQSLLRYPGWRSWRFEGLGTKDLKSQAISLSTGLERHYIPAEFPAAYREMQAIAALASFAFRLSGADLSATPASMVGTAYLASPHQHKPLQERHSPRMTESLPYINSDGGMSRDYNRSTTLPTITHHDLDDLSFWPFTADD